MLKFVFSIIILFLFANCAQRQLEENAYSVGQTLGAPQVLTQKANDGYIDKTVNQKENPFNR